MINTLCTACMNACKQLSSAKIVRCPKFRKRLSEDEFKNLVNELDAAEDRATALSRRVKDLIAKALSGGMDDAGNPESQNTSEDGNVSN